MDDDSLEGLFRASLAERADDVSGDDPSVRAASARAGVRRRRRVAAAVGVAAAVAVITPIAVVAATRDASPTPVADHPSSWRAESYNGIQLWVPPSWGWGMTPTRDGEGLRQCGYGAYAGSGSTGDLRYSKADAAPPYVGRPMAVGPSCPAPPRQQVAHVWFDSPQPVGVRGPSTTIDVQGLTPFTITVTDADSAERNAIVDSIERVDTDAYGCPDRPVAELPSTRSTTVESMTVCVYAARGASRGQDVSLLYSTSLPDPLAQQGYDGIQAAARAPAYGSQYCVDVKQGVQYVDVTAETSDDGSVTFRLRPSSCEGPLMYLGADDSRPITKASVRGWAVDAVPLYAGGDSFPNALTPYLPH